MNNEQFNLKETSWFVRVDNEAEYNAVVYWAKSNGFERFSNQKGFRSAVKAVSHDPSWVKGFIYSAGEHTMNDPRFKEVVVEFEKSLKIKSTALPVVESEQALEIRELREEINNMRKKLEELEKSFE